jgi:hypothetical protein
VTTDASRSCTALLKASGSHELDEGFDPRFEVYDLLWEDFATATDDEAIGDELSE